MINTLRSKINEYFVGKEAVVEDCLVCLLAGGHILLEDVPGVGKTMLARTIAKAVDLSFGRIQFTPDTLPSDVTGLSVYNMKTGEFEYKEGAVMHQIILADEINRTSPKTQASLLEAMAEQQVTVDGVMYELPCPFMVIATQNPIEFLGTYPLPEAQMDRFMMRLSLGYPEEADEMRMTRNFLDGKTVEELCSVCTAEDILGMQEAVRKVYVSDAVLRYVRSIAESTRKEQSFVMGASPRATLLIVRAAQAKSYLAGRDFVKPDDVKAIAVNTLHHRLTLTPEAKIQKENMDSILKRMLLQVKVPVE